MNSKQEFIDAVRAYAIAHYLKQVFKKNKEQDGWDYVVESYSDSQIADLIKTARSVAGAIKMVRADCKARADYRAEIQAEAF